MIDASAWESLYEAALEHADDGIIVVDCPNGQLPFVVRYVNAAFERQTGYTRDELLGSDPMMLRGGLTNAEAMREITQAALMLRPCSAELMVYRKDGTPFWAALSVSPVPDSQGKLAGAFVIQRDVTELVETRQALELLSAAIDHANDGILMFRWVPSDSTWRTSHVNETFQKIMGYEVDEVVGQTSDFLCGELTDRERLLEFREMLANDTSIRGEIAFYRKDGTPVWMELSGRSLRDASGVLAYSVIVYRDVTESRERAQRLSYEASHDALTGAFNRRFFVTEVENALLDARRRGTAHALLFLDLDGFKSINDQHGHEAGDRLLAELTAALQVRMREGDLLARMGGDEFAILLASCQRMHAERIAQQTLELVQSLALRWNTVELRVGASIGAVLIGDAPESAADALRRADQACYAAKRGGRNRVVFG